MIYPEAMLKPADHEDRMRAARERASFELGNPDWANKLLYAYFDPASDHADLLEALKEES